jgi:hypothetical protein
MTKRQLINALKDFNDDDHLQIGEDAIPYVPHIQKICGKSQRYTAHYCVREVGHSDKCYSSCKDTDFIPD